MSHSDVDGSGGTSTTCPTRCTLVADVERRSSQLTGLGHVRVIECADPALAALITRDRATRALCRPIGDRHLAVLPDQELKFLKALLKLGHVIPADVRGGGL